MSGETWVTVTRHDNGTDIEDICGEKVGVILVDLGASFDPRPLTAVAAEEWFDDLREQAKNAPATVKDHVEFLVASYRTDWLHLWPREGTG